MNIKSYRLTVNSLIDIEKEALALNVLYLSEIRKSIASYLHFVAVPVSQDFTEQPLRVS